MLNYKKTHDMIPHCVDTTRLQPVILLRVAENIG